MSRYLTFLLLALSATSVLAAPADIQLVPAVDPLIVPVVGPRSSKVYSPNTLSKRDSQYPASTKDCLVSEHSATHSYTHDGRKYSEDCLTSLALSVPSENRKACRTTGANAHGYDEECLFKKAFDEDWKFDLEKTKEEELAWRNANPTRSSSEAWRTNFPTAINDCIIGVDVDVDVEVGGKKDVTKTSDAGWSPYSVVPGSGTIDNDCLLRLVIRAEIVIDLGTCTADGAAKPKSHSLSDVAAPVRHHGLRSLTERSSAELATRAIDVALNILAALRLGCLIDIVEELIALIGPDVALLLDPLVDLVTTLLGTLL